MQTSSGVLYYIQYVASYIAWTVVYKILLDYFGYDANHQCTCCSWSEVVEAKACTVFVVHIQFESHAVLVFVDGVH